MMIGFEERQKLPKISQLKTQKVIKRNIYEELQKVYGSVLPEIVMSAIVNRYTDLNKPNDKTIMQENLLRFNNDIHYSIPAIRTALVHSQNRNEFSDTYLYCLGLEMANHADFLLFPQGSSLPHWVHWWLGGDMLLLCACVCVCVCVCVCLCVCVSNSS